MKIRHGMNCPIMLGVSLSQILALKIIRTERGKFETTVYWKPNSTSEVVNNKCKTPYTYEMLMLQKLEH